MVFTAKEEKHKAVYEAKKDGNLGDKVEAAQAKVEEKLEGGKKDISEATERKPTDAGIVNSVTQTASDAYEYVAESINDMIGNNKKE